VDLESIGKVGEGTFGEAFKVGAGLAAWPRHIRCSLMLDDYTERQEMFPPCDTAVAMWWRFFAAACCSLPHVSYAQAGRAPSLCATQAEGVVFKIVPLDGELLVNGEVQKRASDIVAEVDIAIQLSRLRGDPGVCCQTRRRQTAVQQMQWPFISLFQPRWARVKR